MESDNNEDMPQSENELSPRIRTIDFLSKFGENDKAQGESMPICDGLTLGPRRSRTLPLFPISPSSELGSDRDNEDMPQSESGPRAKCQTDLHATMLALTKLPAPKNAEEEELLRLTLGQKDIMQGLTGLPQPVNDQLKDLVGHALGTHHPQPDDPTQPQPWPIHFYYYPYPPLPSMQANYLTSYLLTQNPTLVQPLMPPHQADTENQPQRPLKRDLPAPQRGDQSRRRSEKYSAPKNGKSQTISPPFRWATDRRATVHDLKTLAERGIADVSGDVCCTHCGKQFSLSYNIADGFSKLRAFVEAGKDSFNQRAPEEWTKPVLPDCRLCGWKNCCKPVIAEKKKNINWLFLLLGSLLGLCSLEQLKYFCKHTLNHRTGAKDRVMYLAYLGLCKQLDETGPFEALD